MLASPELVTAITATNNDGLSFFTARIIAFDVNGFVTVTVHV
jgi:hypothetical protein